MPLPIPALAVSAYTVTSALGTGLAAHASALRHGRSGLRPNDFGPRPLPCWIGRVQTLEHQPLPAALHTWDCRNNRLAWLGLAQDDFLARVAAARQRYGSDRVALLLGTSTASIGATEAAYRGRGSTGDLDASDLARPQVHTPHSLTGFVAAALELTGPTLTISTACSSSAKVFASAERMIRLGLIDAAVVGGVDSLCDSTLYGFNALELISAQPCRPFDEAGHGISIGEAAGFALLERADAAPNAPRLLGYGESSDAHHMSAPHPQGQGAELALAQALTRAAVTATQVDYINLHGTGSRSNDAVEAALVARHFTPATHASSTKSYTGHTLGAAGIVEAVISLLTLRDGWIAGNLPGERPRRDANLRWHSQAAPVRLALSHSFGFGGNNACLLFAAAQGSA
jgi:3-oxoacyl-[acyl-carrier-protein] synthase-1